MSNGPIKALTGIRGLAAIWVVTFHGYPLLGSLFGLPERSHVLVVHDGFLAVDLFFVLSGFVLSVAYNERFHLDFRSSLASFAVARVYRIFPLHWATLAILLLLVSVFPREWWGPGPFTRNAFAMSAALLQDWSHITALAWNHPTWSLSAEWSAYLLFPALSWGLNLIPSSKWALGWAAFSLLTLDGLILNTGSHSLDHVGPAGMVRCFCEFSAGALAWKAVSLGQWNSQGLGNAAFGLGVGLLSFALIVPELQLLAPFAFVALVIGSALPSEGATRVFGNAISFFLGEISFSIYLVHVIVLGCIATAIDALHLRDASLASRLSVTMAFPLLVLAAAYLTWRHIEKPFQALAHAGRRSSRHSPLAS